MLTYIGVLVTPAKKLSVLWHQNGASIVSAAVEQRVAGAGDGSSAHGTRELHNGCGDSGHVGFCVS